MNHYAGIDVSLESSHVCVIDGSVKIVREAKVASEPEALIPWFGSMGLVPTRIGLETTRQVLETGYHVRALDNRFRSEIRHVNDRGITLPTAARVAIPLADVSWQMGALVQRCWAPAVALSFAAGSGPRPSAKARSSMRAPARASSKSLSEVIRVPQCRVCVAEIGPFYLVLAAE
jgi:hypothetical protein